MEKRYTLITGATGGLGRSFCFLLAGKNKNLILSATNIDRLNVLKTELLSINKDIDIQCFECNMADELSRKKLFDGLKNGGFLIEMLINNAGYITEGSIEKTTRDTLIQTIRVNCEGTIDITKFIIDNHNDKNKLNILTISSFAALQPMPYMAIYAASKSFLMSFMTALRQEVKDKNIIVSTALPSGIYTTNAMKEAIKSQGIGGRLSSHTPDYIARYAYQKAIKGKAIIIPGVFNRFTKIVSICVTYNGLAKIVGKRWKKSQEKRNMV